MHDLAPLNALGGADPREAQIGSVILREHVGFALASVTARQVNGAACKDALARLLGAPVPGPDQAVLSEPYAALWIAAESWLVAAPSDGHEDLAARLAEEMGAAASVTEQSDGWVTIDLEGADVPDMLERLCPAPVRRMQGGAARRTTIHQMGCFLICRGTHASFRLIGPRSSADSLWHALEQAARAVHPIGD